MKFIGILLIIVGLAGFGLGSVMFGDIGLSAMVAGFVGMLAGIAVYRIPGTIKKVIAAQEIEQSAS